MTASLVELVRKEMKMGRKRYYVRKYFPWLGAWLKGRLCSRIGHAYTYVGSRTIRERQHGVLDIQHIRKKYHVCDWCGDGEGNYEKDACYDVYQPRRHR